MPPGFEDYIPLVTLLCDAAGLRHDQDVHITIDEKVVEAGMSQRRPGPHIDGRFMPDLGRWGGGGGWLHYCNHVPVPRMEIIVAASVEGCRAWEGTFHADTDEKGDLSHIAHKLGEGEILPANVAYLLSPDCVHESMIYDRPTQRQFLRMAFSR